MGKHPSVTLCMPVGPQGICPSTAQMIAGLFYRRSLDGLIFGQSHVIPARNMAWNEAVKRGSDRILWCDSDVYAGADDLIAWLAQVEAKYFTANEKIGSVGSVVARRGGGWNFQLFDDRVGDDVWLGMGLVYWHVPRVLKALAKAGRNSIDPFRWVPPHSEDYEISSLLGRFGCWQSVDPTLPTWHDNVGRWEGGVALPGGPSTEASVRGRRKSS